MNKLFLAVTVLLLGSQATFAAEPWPAWRRDGTGVSNEKNLPVEWSETENVVWRTPLPGEGNSSPIIWANRVFVTAALDEGAKRLVLCLDARNGKVLWKTELLPDAKTLLYPKTGFAAPTPTTDSKRVFAFFDSPGLVALDMQGKVVWKRALGPFKAVYNLGTSTVLYKDMVIQSCDHKGEAFIAAFRQSDGSECWRTPRKSSGFGHFGTPMLIQVQGRPQLVVNGEVVASYDPDTGKELWSCRGMKVCVGPSTVFGHGLVYASSGRIGPIMGIDPSGHGDVTETHVRMNLTTGGPYVPSPLMYPHLMVPGDNGKMLFYGANHELVVEGQVRDHFSSSPIGGDGKIYWCSERGKTYVIDAAALTATPPAVKVLAVNQIKGVCLASPAVAGGRLFIRTLEALYCIGKDRAPVVAQTTQTLTGTFVELRKRFDDHQAFWQNEKEAQIRLEAVEAIGKLDDPEVIPFLLHVAVKEAHWDICEEAAKCLARKGTPAIDSLMTLVPDSRPFIRTIAINELGRMKVAKAVPGLIKALRDKEPLVRSASLQALTRIGLTETPDFPQIITAMVATLSPTEEPVVRQSALEGLAALGSKVTTQRREVIEALTAVEAGPNPGLAQKARQMLSPDGVYHR
ncbi:MAG: HEAT repeat domain-containing protein [Verrucomicrobia bacterium]|nr:HEAT repeat domain-containing protein [Verrucomicrobiota bacterium]